MGTVMRMSEAATNGEESKSFDPRSIHRRIPTDDLTEIQTRVCVAAIRNPNTDLAHIANANNVSPTTVLNSLKALIRGGGMDGEGHVTASELRGTHRPAEDFAELTPKQAGVIDWLARRPGAERPMGEGGVASERIATAVEKSEAYPDVDAMHSTYPRKVLERYGDLLEERREMLAAAGELEDSHEEEVLESFYGKPVRRLLDIAGVEYPESNLDDLDTIEEDPITLEQAFEEALARAQNSEETEPVTEEDRREYTAPYSCPECGHEGREDYCGKCGADKRYDWAKPEDERVDEDTPDVLNPEKASGPVPPGVIEGDTKEARLRGPSDEMTLDKLLGEDEIEALNDVLINIRERLETQDQAIETLLSTALMEHEFEDRGVTKRDLKSYNADLEEKLSEFEDRVWEALHNSVGSSLMDRVDKLEDQVLTTEASHAETVSLLEEFEERLTIVEQTLGAVETEQGCTMSRLHELEDAWCDLPGSEGSTETDNLAEALRVARDSGMDVEINISMGGE